MLGVGDLAAILVSIALGTLTIPVAAWLSRRTFGPGAGAAAAAFAALSGPHVAFSRMALTDASFLLFWLVAIGHGPAIRRTAQSRSEPSLLGLAVGLSQLFKYNGWISGIIVALSCGRLAVVAIRSRLADGGDGRHLGLGARRGDRRGRRLLAVVCVR